MIERLENFYGTDLNFESKELRSLNKEDFQSIDMNNKPEPNQNNSKKKQKKDVGRAASSELYKWRRLRSKTKKREEIIKKNIFKNLRYQKDRELMKERDDGDDKESKFLNKFKKMVDEKEIEEKRKNGTEEPNLMRSSYTSNMMAKIRKMKNKRQDGKFKKKSVAAKYNFKKKAKTIRGKKAKK